MAGQQAPSLWQEATRTFPFKNKQAKLQRKFSSAAVEHLSKVGGDCCLQAWGVEMLWGLSALFFPVLANFQCIG